MFMIEKTKKRYIFEKKTNKKPKRKYTYGNSIKQKFTVHMYERNLIKIESKQ